MLSKAAARPCVAAAAPPVGNCASSAEIDVLPTVATRCFPTADTVSLCALSALMGSSVSARSVDVAL
jgi:hypothetical protein